METVFFCINCTKITYWSKANTFGFINTCNTFSS